MKAHQRYRLNKYKDAGYQPPVILSGSGKRTFASHQNNLCDTHRGGGLMASAGDTGGHQHLYLYPAEISALLFWPLIRVPWKVLVLNLQHMDKSHANPGSTSPRAAPGALSP